MVLRLLRHHVAAAAAGQLAPLVLVSGLPEGVAIVR